MKDIIFVCAFVLFVLAILVLILYIRCQGGAVC